MIGFLTGKIISVGTDNVILDVQGVGYNVQVTNDLLSNTQDNQELSLFIHTAVREDAITLYGFVSEEDLTFFKQLLSVSGIGPKLALGILSSSSELVKQAVVSGDEAMLSTLPGIGKKTAARIILDLKSKVVATTTMKPRSIRDGSDDAVEALTNLGYDRGMILRVVNDLPEEISGTEEIVKYFLKSA
jgi:Holliday junction DNA helicase RuvA